MTNVDLTKLTAEQAKEQFPGSDDFVHVYKPRFEWQVCRDRKILIDYQNNKSSLGIAHEIGLSVGRVQSIIRLYNISRRVPWANSRKNKLDESYFDKIDTEEKAYWLGFIATDGNVLKTRRRRVLYMGLQTCDREHLEKLKRAIKTDALVRLRKSKGAKNNKSIYLRVHSTRLVDVLISHGIIPHKTKRISPWNGPYHLMRHYWRGCVDGDGSLYYSKRNKQPHVFFCGNRHMANGLADYIKITLNITSKIEKHSSIFKIRHGGSRIVKKIANLLYGKCEIFLDRKQKLANRIMGSTC